ncbi:hypothetical protein DM01DRAFT_1410400 [Hesseltinella vesiculosa]|uniref:Chitin-binding type-4 domain-containing protein n=1 Tax=Hesseltinella vesiculosa TaxID=101127 RepID=A0A1X2G7E2_9FUNG|nr:hypothetical protein DM01DRAFT_1410400 [Hesseltinella vesiculosa]
MKSIMLLVVTAIIFVSMVASVPWPNTTYTLSVNSPTSFCMFMPPHKGDSVGGTISKGVPQCTSSKLSNSHRVFPKGFIVSAHYAINNTEHFEQITGKIDPSKYGLSTSDQGGQYDYQQISGVLCNYDHFFVALLEPAHNRFCIRCCKYSRDCVTDESSKGCPAVIPGAY